MADSTGASVWRDLALALGGGLAFGVGVKLTQSAGRQPGVSHPDMAQLAERLVPLERRLEEVGEVVSRPAPALPDESLSDRFDCKELEGLVAAANARLEQRLDGIDQRLLDFQARLDRQELGAADVRESYRGLTEEFQNKLNATLHRPADLTAERRLQEMRDQIDVRDREVARLREQLAQSDSRTWDLLQCLTETMRLTVERIPVPQQAGADGVPSFALSPKPAKRWRVPLVSSLVITAGALAFLHYI